VKEALLLFLSIFKFLYGGSRSGGVLSDTRMRFQDGWSVQVVDKFQGMAEESAGIAARHYAGWQP